MNNNENEYEEQNSSNNFNYTEDDETISIRNNKRLNKKRHKKRIISNLQNNLFDKCNIIFIAINFNFLHNCVYNFFKK